LVQLLQFIQSKSGNAKNAETINSDAA